METTRTRTAFRPWYMAAIVALFAAMLYGGTTLVKADHGSEFIDMSITDNVVDHNDALFVQGGVGAGTGNFDPFLTVSPGGSTTTEQGYNTTPPGEFDTFFGGDRTHTLSAAAVPTVCVGGVLPDCSDGILYREFALDYNETGAEDFISIDVLKFYLDDQDDLTDYDDPTSSFGTDNDAPEADLIYDMDAGADTTMLLCTQSCSSGSGVSDMSVLIPDSAFPAECYYGSSECGLWIYLYFAAGAYVDDGSDPIDGEQDWGVTAGFEEWSTELVPVVNVTKTADTSFDQDYDWTVDKKVKVDGECADDATVDLFNGESQDAEWCIEVTRTLGDQSNQTVSGEIEIYNPTGPVNQGGSGIILDAIPAVVVDIDDVLSSLDFTGDVTATVDCGGPLPITVDAGDTLVCTYEASTPEADNGTIGVNTVNVLLEDNPLAFEATANFDFALAVSGDETNESATLTDIEGALDQLFTESGSTSYVNTYSCDADEGETSNTATITPNDGGTADEDTSTLTLNCYDITVTKDAATSLTRTHNWTIDKSVDPATWDLFNGESGTSEYTVVVNSTGSTDSAWAVSGNITVSNVGNPIAATINSVSDVVSVGINGTVDCGAAVFPYTIPAGGTLACTYTASLPDATGRTNTATATQQLYDYDEDGVATAGGTDGEDGTAAVSFAAPTVTVVNNEIDITDTHPDSNGPWECDIDSDPCTFTYEVIFECGDDAGDHDNTAEITQTGQTDDATVTVNCYDISVSKDATPTFTRTYLWTIDKTSPCTVLELAIGEVYDDCDYTVTVDLADPAYADSAWAVTGNITVSNVGNPIPAEITGLTDVIFDGINATVDCTGDASFSAFPHTIAAGGTLACTYSSNLADGTTRLNTATATQQLYDYDKDLNPTDAGTDDEEGTANIVFGDPTTVIDESVTVTDDHPLLVSGALGNCTADTAPCVFNYSITFGPYSVGQCGEIVVPNTATFTTDDSGTTGTDGHTVTITVDCPSGDGCTLTQGYWKTHSSYGPAGPADPTWELLPDGPDTDFFGTGETWYDVFWTAPRGNFSYNLAHQYMAAYLNTLTGADVPADVQAALDAAEAWFEANGLDRPSNPEKQTLTGPHGILGSYNEGDIGPGHCDQDEIAGAQNAKDETIR